MEKRALINFVLSNATIEGKKLRYKAKFTFDMVLKYAPRSEWLPVHELIRNLHEFITSPDVIGAKSAHFSTL